MDSDKLKRLTAAYREADLIYDDIPSITASMEIDVPDATPMEIAEAIGAYAKIAKVEADLHTRWAEEQRKLGRPEHELTWSNCVHELNLWRPSKTN